MAKKKAHPKIKALRIVYDKFQRTAEECEEFLLSEGVDIWESTEFLVENLAFVMISIHTKHFDDDCDEDFLDNFSKSLKIKLERVRDFCQKLGEANLPDEP